jgi:hypothetical protein
VRTTEVYTASRRKRKIATMRQSRFFRHYSNIAAATAATTAVPSTVHTDFPSLLAPLVGLADAPAPTVTVPVLVTVGALAGMVLVRDVVGMKVEGRTEMEVETEREREVDGAVDGPEAMEVVVVFVARGEERVCRRNDVSRR